jgi:hypothetical protein
VRGAGDGKQFGKALDDGENDYLKNRHLAILAGEHLLSATNGSLSMARAPVDSFFLRYSRNGC